MVNRCEIVKIMDDPKNVLTSDAATTTSEISSERAARLTAVIDLSTCIALDDFQQEGVRAFLYN